MSRLLVGINDTEREVHLVEINEERRENENEGRERVKLLSRLARAIGIRWQINIF